MKADKDERGGRPILPTRVRLLPAGRGEYISTFGIWGEELATRAIVHASMVRFRPGAQAKQSIDTGVLCRDGAAGGYYQSGPAAKGPNCSIVGAAAFSSGRMCKD